MLSMNSNIHYLVMNEIFKVTSGCLHDPAAASSLWILTKNAVYYLNTLKTHHYSKRIEHLALK